MFRECLLIQIAYKTITTTTVQKNIWGEAKLRKRLRLIINTEVEGDKRSLLYESTDIKKFVVHIVHESKLV